jgi:hypothetical protein
MPKAAKPKSTPPAAAPHKLARRAAAALPEIVRAAEVEYPLLYRNKNKHPRNGQSCREVPLVASPENMLAVRFADGERLVVFRRDVHELDDATDTKAGTEPDRIFWGTR